MSCHAFQQFVQNTDKLNFAEIQIVKILHLAVKKLNIMQLKPKKSRNHIHYLQIV